jgi:site-specific recombinase XerD
VAKAKPASVNLSLAAIDNFYRFLGMGKPDVAREDLPGVAPGSLAPEEQKRFLRAVERSDSPRDRAMARVLFFAGLRVSELVGLDSNSGCGPSRPHRRSHRRGRDLRDHRYRRLPGLR